MKRSEAIEHIKSILMKTPKFDLNDIEGRLVDIKSDICGIECLCDLILRRQSQTESQLKTLIDEIGKGLEDE